MLETKLLLADKVNQGLSASATRSKGKPAKDMSYCEFPLYQALRERCQPHIEGHRKMSRILGQG